MALIRRGPDRSLRQLGVPALGGAIAIVMLVGSVSAQPSPSQPSGRSLFETYCAVCHGRSGRGDGPLAEQMKTRPPDLTLFAARNGGTFPAALVGKIIDGRQPLPGHGGPDMPVWGDAFRRVNENSGMSATARIDAVVKYPGVIAAGEGQRIVWRYSVSKGWANGDSRRPFAQAHWRLRHYRNSVIHVGHARRSPGGPAGLVALADGMHVPRQDHVAIGNHYIDPTGINFGAPR